MKTQRRKKWYHEWWRKSSHEESNRLVGFAKAEKFQDPCSLWYCFGRKKEVWNTCKKWCGSQVGTGVVCLVATKFIVLEEFSSAARCDCICYATWLKFVWTLLFSYLQSMAGICSVLSLWLIGLSFAHLKSMENSILNSEIEHSLSWKGSLCELRSLCFTMLCSFPSLTTRRIAPCVKPCKQTLSDMLQSRICRRSIYRF